MLATDLLNIFLKFTHISAPVVSSAPPAPLTTAGLRSGGCSSRSSVPTATPQTFGTRFCLLTVLISHLQHYYFSYTETFSMSTTVCASNYEYQGQVYSPAFSEPSSPMSSTTSSQPPSPKPDLEYDFEEEFVSKRPKFANKYEEMLQPLDPVRTLPCHQIKHNSRYDFYF